METPTRECSGYARFTQTLARELGLNCKHAVGAVRGLVNTIPSRHSWNYFDFGNGVCSVADSVNGSCSLAGARGFPGKGMWDWQLPKSPMEFELFLSRLNSYERIDGPFEKEVYEKTRECSLTTMSYSEWQSTDPSGLKDADAKYSAYEAKLAKSLSAVTDIRNIRD